MRLSEYRVSSRQISLGNHKFGDDLVFCGSEKATPSAMMRGLQRAMAGPAPCAGRLGNPWFQCAVGSHLRPRGKRSMV